MTHLLTYLEA